MNSGAFGLGMHGYTTIHAWKGERLVRQVIHEKEGDRIDQRSSLSITVGEPSGGSSFGCVST